MTKFEGYEPFMCLDSFYHSGWDLSRTFFAKILKKLGEGRETGALLHVLSIRKQLPANLFFNGRQSENAGTNVRTCILLVLSKIGSRKMPSAYVERRGWGDPVLHSMQQSL